jgi:hypothetical protein
MPNNKKNKTTSPAAEVERLKMQNEQLQARITNQRRALAADSQCTTVGKLARVQDVTSVANRNSQSSQTMGQNTPQRFGNSRSVMASGGMLSTREVNLLYRELGSTDDGRNWATCALHPCSENLPPVQGIPDRSAQPIATPSYRNTSTIAMPTGLSETNWDCQIVTIPIPEVDYIWRARPNAAGEWSAWNVVRPAAFPGMADGSGQTLGTAGYSKYRMMGRGFTVHHLASATTNQGLTVAGQISGLVEDFQGQSTNATLGNAPINQTVFDVPAGPQQLTQQTNLATEWEATHGSYMPMRFNQTVELYKQCSEGISVPFAGDLNAPEHFVTIISATTEGGPAGVNNVVVNPAPTFTAPSDLPLATQMIYAASQAANQLVGVIFYLGIDKAATLQVKSRTHIEATADAGGYSIQPFVHSSPVMDTQALDVVAKVAQVQKHCYYAEYNDLGKMMKSIWNAIWPIGKYAATGLLSALPVIGGPLAATASKVNNPFRGTDWWSNL